VVNVTLQVANQSADADSQRQWSLTFPCFPSHSTGSLSSEVVI